MFKKDCVENAPIYAKVLLECENTILKNAVELNFMLNLLSRLRVLFVVYRSQFGLSYDEANAVREQFIKNMTLIDPKYREGF